MWTYYRLPHLRPRDPAPSLIKVGTMQTFFFESSFAPSFEVGGVLAEALNIHEQTGLTPAQLQARVAELEGALREYREYEEHSDFGNTLYADSHMRKFQAELARLLP